MSYNSAATLQRCWGHALKHDARWIVVDNQSADESIAVARKLGADVVTLPENRGFARANNVGLERASTEYVAFVNPDVKVDFDSLPILADLIEQAGGLVSPQLINEDGSVQSSARGLPFLVDKFAHRGLRLPGSQVEAYLPQVGERSLVCWNMGAAVCGRRETFERLGGWDSSFFLYYEDHDLGLRAWRAGVPVLATSRARWQHSWARETMSFRIKPWLREVGSARRFYSRYPELILPTRRWAAYRHRNYAQAIGL